MKTMLMFCCLLTAVACNHSGASSKTADSTSINTKTSSPADGGPNNGLGDTNTYNRSSDTVLHDSANRK